MAARGFDPRIYWEERLERSFGLDSVGYLGLGKRYNAWMYRVRRVVFRRTVDRLGLDLPSTEVLDVGSGTGFYLAEWRALGVGKLVGIDLTEAAASRLRERFTDVEIHRLDISEGPGQLEGRSFDAISAFDILYHVVDDERYEAALRTMHDLLRPGGWLLFTDNFLHDGEMRAENQVSRSLTDIREVLDRVGLELLDRRPIFYLMNNPVDNPPRELRLMWSALRRFVSRAEALGFVAGAALFPIEITLVKLARESPTTELAVCRRRG